MLPGSLEQVIFGTLARNYSMKLTGSNINTAREDVVDFALIPDIIDVTWYSNHNRLIRFDFL